jgi:hypothetical protein
MKNAISWLVGFAVTAATYLPVSFLAQELRIVVSGGEYMNSEGDMATAISLFGACLTVLSCTVGTLVGRMVWYNSASAGLERKDKYGFAAWILGSASLLLLSGLIQMAFLAVHNDFAWLVQYVIEGFAIVGVFWAWRQWWKIKCSE